jgi:hypothetical protein
MKRKILAIALILLGSFLEIWFYYWRFYNDGIHAWLSFIIGISLTLMLALAVYRRTWLIIMPLALYSVWATSAGQAFSLNASIEVDSQARVQQLYLQEDASEIEEQISRLDANIEQTREQINATVTSLEDRYEWKNTLARAEEVEQELTTERKELQQQLREIRSKITTHETIEHRGSNIYEFYSELFGWSERWLQFLMQTLLSAFIAAMAPLGIIIYNESEPKPKKIDKNAVERWVSLNWIGIRNGKSKTILPRQVFFEYLRKRNESYSEKLYDKIRAAAIKGEIINEKNEIFCTNEKKSIDKIMSID